MAVNIQVGLALIICMGCWAPCAVAYPEFQTYAEKNSGRNVNCAMCHAHPNGPTGAEHGQVGGLTPEKMQKLQQARQAMEPGAEVDSPVLNEFGNKIVKAIGRRQFLDMRSDPAKLQAALGAGDLDEDGIPDGKEFAQGTDALNPNHGDPWELFLQNLQKYAPHVGLAFLAILMLDYGFVHLLKGMSLTYGKSHPKGDDE
jgi:hypothetical protein